MGFRLSELGSDPPLATKTWCSAQGCHSVALAACFVVCWAARAIRAPQLSVTITPQTKVYLRRVVVQYLHFRAGISELRAPPHMLVWGWLALAAQPAHLLCSPRALWMEQGSRKSGQWLPVGSGVVLVLGRWSKHCCWCEIGRGRANPAQLSQVRPAQRAGARVPPPPSCPKCWMDWSACGNADDPQLTTVKMLGLSIFSNWQSYSGCLLEVVMTLLQRAYTESFWKMKCRTKIGGYWAKNILLKYWFELLAVSFWNICQNFCDCFYPSLWSRGNIWKQFHSEKENILKNKWNTMSS